MAGQGRPTLNAKSEKARMVLFLASEGARPEEVLDSSEISAPSLAPFQNTEDKGLVFLHLTWDKLRTQPAGNLGRGVEEEHIKLEGK